MTANKSDRGSESRFDAATGFQSVAIESGVIDRFLNEEIGETKRTVTARERERVLTLVLLTEDMGLVREKWKAGV